MSKQFLWLFRRVNRWFFISPRCKIGGFFSLFRRFRPKMEDYLFTRPEFIILEADGVMDVELSGH
jgi:hypothetical protein